MKLLDYIIIALVLTGLAFALRSIKKHKCCGGSCEGCPMHCDRRK